MKILALDLSLTATGYARSLTDFGTLEPPDDYKGMQRIHWIYMQVTDLALDTELLMIEDFSMKSNNPGAQERIGLAFLIRYWAWKRSIPYCLVAPLSLKKFVLGSAKGKSGDTKSLIVRAVFQRWNVEVNTNDEADAIVLHQIGRVLAAEMEPTTDAQREVIKGLNKKGRVPELLVTA